MEIGKGRWVKLYEKLLKSPYFKEPKLLQLVIYCLLRANWQANDVLFNGQIVHLEPGQFITGLNVMSKATGLTRRELRTRLNLLEKSEFLTSKSTSKYRIITVLNWHMYQGKENGDNQIDIEATIKRQGSDKQATTNKNIKKDKNVKNDNIYIPVFEIVTYLNKATGKNFKVENKKTLGFIKARIKDGYKLDDFKAVIDRKVTQWKFGDMDKYLRPETLFGNKFESYMNEPDKVLSKNQQAVADFIRSTDNDR